MARNRQPWFVPDFGDNWQWSVALAVRISRLGKCIQPKFASRYYDARTLLLLPSCSSPQAPQWSQCMDGAAIAGDWMPLTENIMNINGTMYDMADFGFDSFIAEASKIVTLKTGDIIAMPLESFKANPATIDSHVELYLDNSMALSFNIK